MATGMASVMAKILCRNVNSSKSVILAKCKTDRELSCRQRASKISDRVELDPVKELQSAKARKDRTTKVGVNSLFGFGCSFSSIFRQLPANSTQYCLFCSLVSVVA